MNFEIENFGNVVMFSFKGLPYLYKGMKGNMEGMRMKVFPGASWQPSSFPL